MSSKKEYLRPLCTWKKMFIIRHTHWMVVIKKTDNRVFLVVQWLRIRLPLQGIWVWNLVQEDSTCHRAIKPMHHNYWTSALEPANCKPVLCNKIIHHNEKAAHSNKDPGWQQQQQKTDNNKHWWRCREIGTFIYG